MCVRERERERERDRNTSEIDNWERKRERERCPDRNNGETRRPSTSDQPLCNIGKQNNCSWILTDYSDTPIT